MWPSPPTSSRLPSPSSVGASRSDLAGVRGEVHPVHRLLAGAERQAVGAGAAARAKNAPRSRIGMLVARTTVPAVTVPASVSSVYGSRPWILRTRTPSTTAAPCARASASRAVSSSIGSSWHWSGSRTAPRIGNGSGASSTQVASSTPARCSASSSRRTASLARRGRGVGVRRRGAGRRRRGRRRSGPSRPAPRRWPSRRRGGPSRSAGARSASTACPAAGSPWRCSGRWCRRRRAGLEHQHLPARAGEQRGGGETGDAGADHHDVVVAGDRGRRVGAGRAGGGPATAELSAMSVLRLSQVSPAAAAGSSGRAARRPRSFLRALSMPLRSSRAGAG